MRSGIKVLGLVLIPALIGLFFRFGTWHPCGMLKKESRAEILQKLAAHSRSAQSGVIGNGLALIMGGAIIDNTVDSLSPWQCTKILVQMQTGTPDASPLVSSPATVPVPAIKDDYTEKKPGLRVYRDKQGKLFIERAK